MSSVLDVVLGPLTDTLAHLRQRYRSEDGSIIPASELGQVARNMAWTELGNGEEGGNNQGPHVRRWGWGRENIAHCSAFVCYQVEQAFELMPEGYPKQGELASLFAHPKWPRWRLVAKRAWSELGKIGYHVEMPLPGDLVLFERGRDGDWKGHIEICASVELGSDRFTDVTANLGRYPAIAEEKNRIIGQNRMIGFVRLP